MRSIEFGTENVQQQYAEYVIKATIDENSFLQVLLTKQTSFLQGWKKSDWQDENIPSSLYSLSWYCTMTVSQLLHDESKDNLFKT